jgi:hypothetical protein
VSPSAQPLGVTLRRALRAGPGAGPRSLNALAAVQDDYDNRVDRAYRSQYRFAFTNKDVEQLNTLTWAVFDCAPGTPKLGLVYGLSIRRRGARPLLPSLCRSEPVSAPPRSDVRCGRRRSCPRLRHSGTAPRRDRGLAGARAEETAGLPGAGTRPRASPCTSRRIRWGSEHSSSGSC